jgi:hypothetical protein
MNETFDTLPRLSRERDALLTHQQTLRGSELPAPRRAPRGTFVHGFLLPFSLIASTLRDRELRAPYLKVVLVRALVVLVLALLFGRSGKDPDLASPGPKVVVHRDHKPGSKGVKIDLPGIHVDLADESTGKDEVVVLGKEIPVVDVDEAKVSSKTVAQATWLSSSWARLVAIIGLLSALEAIVVFLSRRWDDWLGFHASRLAAIKPEDETPKDPKIAFDLKWLYRKLQRRVRGYVVFAAGLPVLLPLHFVPRVGPVLFTIAATLWGWYWLGVFSAAKSAHAWADAETARSPFIIRSFNAKVGRHWWSGPLRLYGRAWAWLSRGLDPPGQVFDRTPAAFLGLAAARAVLAAPFLYLLARPIVPIAAGRLCAETDPADRFSIPTGTTSAEAPVVAGVGHRE